MFCACVSLLLGRGATQCKIDEKIIFVFNKHGSKPEVISRYKRSSFRRIQVGRAIHPRPLVDTEPGASVDPRSTGYGLFILDWPRRWALGVKRPRM